MSTNEGQQTFRTRLNSVAIYFSATAIAKAIPFFALPIITVLIGPGDFGSWSLFIAVMSFATPFIGFMTRHQVARTFYAIGTEERATLVSSVLYFTALTAAAVMAILSLLQLIPLQTVFGLPLWSLLAIPILALLVNIQETTMLILRYQDKPFAFAAFELSESILLYAFALTLIVALGWSWESFIAGKLASGVALAAVAFWVLNHNSLLSRRFSPPHVRAALSIGMPLIPHALAGTVIALSDRIILQSMTSLETVGIYSAGYFIGSALLLVATAFSKSWTPWVHARMSATVNEQTKLAIVKWIYAYAAALALTGVCGWIVGHIYIVHLLDSRYHEATRIIPWIAGATLFQGLYFAVFPILTHLGHTRVFATATAIAALVNVAATIVLVRYFGMVGAAQATLIAYVLLFSIVLYATNRYYPLPWLGHRNR